MYSNMFSFVVSCNCSEVCATNNDQCSPTSCLHTAQNEKTFSWKMNSWIALLNASKIWGKYKWHIAISKIWYNFFFVQQIYIRGHSMTTTYLHLDIFNLEHGQKLAFFGPLTSSSCPRSQWMFPKVEYIPNLLPSILQH